MLKQGRSVLVIILLSAYLSGCLGGLWTGASLVYDRHNVYKKLNDYHLLVDVTNALYDDKKFKAQGCGLDIAVFNGDVLVAGHLPDPEFLNEARNRLKTVTGYRRLFNQITINSAPIDTVQDSWITTKIRSQIFADDTINPKAFKVVTSDRIVYLMGDVREAEAKKVIYIARNVSGVERVVTLFKYFTYQSKEGARS